MLRVFSPTRSRRAGRMCNPRDGVPATGGAQKREDPAAPIAARSSRVQKGGAARRGASEVPPPEARKPHVSRRAAATRAFNSWQRGVFVTRPKIDRRERRL